MTGIDTLSPSILPQERVAPMDAGGPPVPDVEPAKFEEGQALAEEMQDPDVWNDPDAVETLFEENAEQLQDPDFAAGFIQAFDPDVLQAVVGQYPYASDEQQVAFAEHFSNALAAASHSDQLSTEWRDGFLSGISDYPSTVGNVGELMRHGDFSTSFLMAAMRELVNIQDSGRGFGADRILEAVARNPEAAALSSAAFAQEMVDNGYLSNWAVASVFEAGAVTYRATDPSMAEYAARQIIGVVYAKDGKLSYEYSDAMAAIAA